MGIVAVLMLPALAMLAGGGSMETLSRDRETASRIAREIVSGAHHGSDGQYLIDFSGGGSIQLPTPQAGADETAYLIFDEKGVFLDAVGVGEYEGGIGKVEGARYLVSLLLSGGDPGEGLESWDLSVEQPAVAARASREAEVFQTRLASP